MTITKEKVYGALAKGKYFLDKASITVMSAASGIGLVGIAASAEEVKPVVDLTGVNFDGLTSAITSMVPQVLPVAVTVLGIRKAISFMISWLLS